MAKDKKEDKSGIGNLMDDSEVKEFFADPKSSKFEKCVRAINQKERQELQEEADRVRAEADKNKPKSAFQETLEFFGWS